jgi:hypothetical protein
MNEEEFRDALRGAMVAGSPPPSMDGRAVLEVARAAQRRRRAAFASAGSAVAIVVIAVGALFVAGPYWPGDPVDPAAPGVSTRTGWPTGPDGRPMQDRTAVAGPRADASARLESALAAAVPPGLTVGPDKAAPGSSRAGGPLRGNQAQFEQWVEDEEVWMYTAVVPVTRDGGTGRLFVMVQTSGNELPDDPCTAARRFLIGPDVPLTQRLDCQETLIGSRRVGVISEHDGDAQFDQWAFYQHPDGTSVYVAQSAGLPDSGLPALAAEPLTLDGLAALAVDPRLALR